MNRRGLFKKLCIFLMRFCYFRLNLKCFIKMQFSCRIFDTLMPLLEKIQNKWRSRTKNIFKHNWGHRQLTNKLRTFSGKQINSHYSNCLLFYTWRRLLSLLVGKERRFGNRKKSRVVNKSTCPNQIGSAILTISPNLTINLVVPRSTQTLKGRPRQGLGLPKYRELLVPRSPRECIRRCQINKKIIRRLIRI